MNEEAIEEKLHQLDLVQIEKVRKLSLRIQNGLNAFDGFTKMQAQVESQQDFRAVGGYVEKEGPSLEQQLENLVTEQSRALLALKKAVWDASNALKQDHDKRQVMVARAREQAELSEV